jgi:pimeloyl-ACP methyl ester carboxylesterase
MERKSLTINGIVLSYFEVNPMKSSKTLLFIHGNSLCAGMFEPVLSDTLFSKYRVIALDLPGHGFSAMSVKPATDYRFNALKSIIIEFATQLNLTEIVLAGHSLGGHIAIQLIPELKEIVNGLVIFGTPPLRSLADGAEAFLPSIALQYAYAGELNVSELRQFASAFGNGKHIEKIEEAVVGCDTKLRPVLGESLFNDRFVNEQEILSLFAPRTLIIHGANDHLINSVYLERLPKKWLYQEKTHTIPDASHMSFLDQPSLFVKLVNEYLTDIEF